MRFENSSVEPEMCSSIALAHSLADQHNGIKTFFYGENLSLITGDAAASIINGINGIVGEGDFLVHLAVFQGQKHRHNLGDTGGIMLLINAFCIENGSVDASMTMADSA